MSRKTFEEGDLRFVFAEGWEVEKYDESHFYRKHLEKVPGTKAVDFLAFSDEQALFLEVKDFRGHRIENVSRISGGDLVDEVAQKVRDTCAALVPRARKNDQDFHLRTCRLLNPNHLIRIILWLEEDRPLSRRNKANRGILMKALKRKTVWLTSKVYVVDRSQVAAVPGIEKVESLPGAGGSSP